MSRCSKVTKSKKMPSITTITLFNLTDASAAVWAFGQMQWGHQHFTKVNGLRFYKLMGSGAGNGFKWHPNWKRYALLAVWEDEKAANDFLATNPFFQKYTAKCNQATTYYLRCFKSHGAWSGQQPFVEEPKMDELASIAVITRATIKTKYLRQFWKEVPAVSDSIEQVAGRQLSVGIGEWPVFQQATFSIWDNAEAMSAYAYGSPLHRKVIQQTRTLGWYKEELFARFALYRVERA